MQMGLTKSKIAFIGLGAMGSRMAQNILKGGFNLTVYNRDRAKAAPFEQQGCAVAGTAVEAAREADFVITMLSNDRAVEQVVSGRSGVMQTMKSGAVFINMSTVSPALARRLEEEGSQCGIKVLAVPVSGSIEPAAKGNLILLAGGERDTFERAEPILKTMGQTIHYFNSGACSLVMKLIINAFIQIQLAAFAELFSLGQAVGLDEHQFTEILMSGAGASPWIKNKANKVMQGDFSSEFSLGLSRKDMGLAAEEFHYHNLPALVTTASDQLYALATRIGHTEEDMSVLVPLLGKLSGLN